MSGADLPVRVATFADLDVLTAYRLWALRAQVFVVEQDCPYLDLDGRDLEPTARHLWVEQDGRPVATLRMLEDPNPTMGRVGAAGGGPGGDSGGDGGGDVVRIGRVATAQEARGQGLAGRLVRAALDVAGERTVVLDAQSHLVDWYAGFGFAPSGRGFLDDGIPHTPMRRPGRQGD